MRIRSSLAVPLAVMVAVVAARSTVCHAAPPAAASSPIDEKAEFDKGRNAYRAQKYEEADARFFNMLDPEHGTLHDKVLIKQARMYWAATQLALHRNSEADGQFEIILTEDKDYEPDPLAFSTEVVNAFIDARARLHAKLDEITRERYRLAAERRANAEAAKQREVEHLKMLERLASEVEVTQKHSRWIALLPFGVGQFQNGQRAAAWFFVATESLFLATGIATVPVYYVDLANARSTYSLATQSVAQQYIDRANIARDVNLIAYGALAAAVVVGAIEAEATYVPNVVNTEPRALPTVVTPDSPGGNPLPPVSLRASPIPGRDGRGISGGSVGVTVAF